MKINLEVVTNDDGKPLYLNWCNSIDGKDVCCDFVNGELVLFGTREKVSLEKIIELIQKRMKNWPKETTA